MQVNKPKNWNYIVEFFEVRMFTPYNCKYFETMWQVYSFLKTCKYTHIQVWKNEKPYSDLIYLK